MAAKPTWTILLIDAQPMSRKSLKSQLEYYQYAVLEADSARQRVQIIVSRLLRLQQLGTNTKSGICPSRFDCRISHRCTSIGQ